MLVDQSRWARARATRAGGLGTAVHKTNKPSYPVPVLQVAVQGEGD